MLVCRNFCLHMYILILWTLVYISAVHEMCKFVPCLMVSNYDGCGRFWLTESLKGMT